MADVSFRADLTMRRGNFKYKHPKSSYTAELNTDTPFGPSPGGVHISVDGTDIPLDDIDVAGWAVFDNSSDDHFFTWGIWDPDFNLFYPVGEVGPGEFYVIKLSRWFLSQFGAGDLGSGSLGASNQLLRAYADTADISGFIGVFEA